MMHTRLFCSLAGSCLASSRSRSLSRLHGIIWMAWKGTLLVDERRQNSSNWMWNDEFHIYSNHLRSGLVTHHRRCRHRRNRIHMIFQGMTERKNNVEKLEFSYYKRKLFKSFTFEMIKYIQLSAIQGSWWFRCQFFRSFFMHFLSRDYAEKNL